MTNDRLVQKYILFFVIIGLGVVIITNLTSFISATLGATIFYILFKKQMIKLVEKRKLNINLASVIIILLSFFIVVLPFTFMGILIVNKIIFYVNDPALLNSLKDAAVEKIKLLPVDIKIDQVFGKVTENILSLIHISEPTRPY